MASMEPIQRILSCAQAYRGQLWRCFLNVDEKAQEGVYDRLVSKALGKPFSSKVLHGALYDMLPLHLCAIPREQRGTIVAT